MAYRRAQQEAQQVRRRISEARAALRAEGLTEDAAWPAISPLATAQSQTEAELAEYEDAPAGNAQVLQAGRAPGSRIMDGTL